MTTSFDLILLPLCRQNDQDQAELPGLEGSQAPRRAARGRSRDQLVVHLSLEGTAPLSPKGYDKLVSYLVETYYKSPGSVTTAMRSVAEWLNNYLIERNLRGASRSMQSVGYLTLAAFRGSRLYLAQCGPTHSYLISSSGSTHYHDSDIAHPGLGLGRVTNIRYHQEEVFSGDLVLISANPPPIWTTAVLNDLKGKTLESVHHRLIHRIGSDLQAALVQVGPGSGKVRVLRPEAVSSSQQTRLIEAPINEKTSERSRSARHGRSQGESKTKLPDTPPQVAVPHLPPLHQESTVGKEGSHSDQPTPEVVSAAPSVEPGKPEEKGSKDHFLGPALLKIGQAVGETIRQGFQSVGKFISRMLPENTLMSLPTSTMAFIAVAVPIVVVSIAATVYVQRGQGKMFEEHYLQAQYAAEQALQISDPKDLRTAWNTVMSYLDEAEAYHTTADSQAMRNYATNVLDNLDLVVRVPFQQALVDPLPSDTIITRIVATEGDNELYLLDGSDGHVLRATRTDRGYILDKDFICEPVPKPLIVGKLVDILPLPLDDPNNATIMGMDGNGNLMQCIPGGKPPLTLQMPSPDMNWGLPSAFVMNNSGLYVLDPLTNAVWIFWHNDEYNERPTLFFDEQVPTMNDVIDLTLNRDDLFLLHGDGQLTTCNFGYPTRCDDPAMINDIREGGGSSPKINDAVFSEIQYNPPPDPSLYLLEPETPAIYHFSVRLTYQRQYQSQTPFPDGPATAFSISPNRQVFIAIDNQVFFGPLP